jgi:hypothetical protein
MVTLRADHRGFYKSSRYGFDVAPGWNPSPYRTHTPHDDARIGDTRLKPADQNGVAAETIAALRAGWADAIRIVLEGSGAKTACWDGAESASTLVTSPLAHNKRATAKRANQILRS